MAESQPSNIVTATVGDLEYWQNVVERMTELTRAGTLKWDVVSTADAKASSAAAVYAAYDAKYDNRIVRFLETEPAGTVGDALAAAVEKSVTLRTALLLPPGKYRKSAYSLLLVDANGNPLFAFPTGTVLVELLAAIKSQIADVESFVEALFAAA